MSKSKGIFLTRRFLLINMALMHFVLSSLFTLDEIRRSEFFQKRALTRFIKDHFAFKECCFFYETYKKKADRSKVSNQPMSLIDGSLNGLMLLLPKLQLQWKRMSLIKHLFLSIVLSKMFQCGICAVLVNDLRAKMKLNRSGALSTFKLILLELSKLMAPLHLLLLKMCIKL